jgi:REP element-mobilizing transposase RayT
MNEVVGRVPSPGDAHAPAQRTEPAKAQPRRLRRLDRVWLGDLWPGYFLTICTEQRQPVLANAAVHERCRAFLADSPQRYRWWPTRYVLMPDHLHLLVHEGPGAVTLGEWVKALKAIVGRREFKWQSSFFDHVMRSEESEAQKWEYVRMNPVRAGLVSQAEEWPFGGEIGHDDAGRGPSGCEPTAPGEGTRPTTHV